MNPSTLVAIALVMINGSSTGNDTVVANRIFFKKRAGVNGKPTGHFCLFGDMARGVKLRQSQLSCPR